MNTVRLVVGRSGTSVSQMYISTYMSIIEYTLLRLMFTSTAACFSLSFSLPLDLAPASLECLGSFFLGGSWLTSTAHFVACLSWPGTFATLLGSSSAALGFTTQPKLLLMGAGTTSSTSSSVLSRTVHGIMDWYGGG
jgi:hypothetical protein